MFNLLLWWRLIVTIYLARYLARYLHIHPAIFSTKSIYLSSYLSIKLSIYPAMYLSIDLFICRSIYPSIYLSIDLYIQLSNYLAIQMYIYLFTFSLKDLPIYHCIHISIRSRWRLRSLVTYLNIICLNFKVFFPTAGS